MSRCMIWIQISLKFVPNRPFENNPVQYSIGSDTGLESNMRQDIIWTIDVYWHIYASLGLDELIGIRTEVMYFMLYLITAVH